jgi:uncharacterized protein (DUF362 family)/ferredoxin
MSRDNAGRAMPRVALVACPGYEREAVRAAVARCVDLLGGREALVQAGARVLVKPNLLLAVGADTHVCTHPEVVGAVVAALSGRDATFRVGDCPMFAMPDRALRRSGIAAVMEELSVQAADMGRTVVAQAPEGRRFRRFEIVAAAGEADLLVNVCKLKTHHTTFMTLAVKNLFGLIAGVEKSKWHLKAPSHAEMTSMLVDLHEAILAFLGERGCRTLHVCDAVVGLEGEGPGAAGTPREVGAIAASTDALALDAVLARLAGFEAGEVSTTAEGARRGLCGTAPEDVEIVGDELEGLAVRGFRPCQGTLASGASRADGFPFNLRFFRERMVERPVVRQAECTGCGECRKVCPAKAIELRGEPPKASIDLDACIRCYCCVEACRFSAARLGPKPLLARVAERRHLLPWIAAGLAAVIAAGAAAALLWQ